MSHSDNPMARSVHDRLLKLSKKRNEDFNAYLVRYGIERLLYRLTPTPHGKRFVLKGAAHARYVVLLISDDAE